MRRLTIEHRGKPYGGASAVGLPIVVVASGQVPLVRPARIRPRTVANWVLARGEACRGCEHQVVAGYEERCELRPEWGCLGKARHRRDRECAAGRWGKASMRELKLNSL
jgi:hypothetical protein